MKKSIKTIFIFITLAFLITGCGGVNPLEDTGDTVGFFGGLWDGFTIIFALIGKMVGFDINIYEVYNNGSWYNLGYLIGILFWGAFYSVITEDL